MPAAHPDLDRKCGGFRSCERGLGNHNSTHIWYRYTFSLASYTLAGHCIHMAERKLRTARLSEAEYGALTEWADRFGLTFSDLLRELGKSLPAQQALLLAALEEIRGQFNRSEVSCMLDSCNGLALLGGLLGQHVAIEVLDSPHMNEKWGVDVRDVSRRLRELTDTQRIALEMWIASMWSRCEDDTHWETQITWLATAPATKQEV